jgi:hypothetical protein
VKRAKEEGRFEEEEWRASLERVESVCARAEAPGPRPSMDVLGYQENQQLSEGIRARLR